MKTPHYLTLMLIPLLLAGCTKTQDPLDSGIAVSGKVWERSFDGPGGQNSGMPIPPDTKVDVYESIVIIHWSDGTRQIAPMDHITDLKLK